MAAARAAARRQAILGSRGNRLAKLTSSARGDDPGGVYATDDPPLPTIGSKGIENLVGEKPTLPNPSVSSRPSSLHSLANISGAHSPEWDADMQQEIIRALTGDIPGRAGLGTEPSLETSGARSASALEDPFSALLASLTRGASATTPATEAPHLPQKSLAQKLIPVLHALSMLAILVWFIFWKEPEVFAETWNLRADNVRKLERSVGPGWRDGHGWTRWSTLAQAPPAGGVVIPSLPTFFWAFITLQLALHSLRLVSQPDAHRPPMLLEFIMPHLPPPLPQLILTSLKYLQMGSMVLNDLAILVFGIGLVIFVSSNWMT